MTLRRALGGNFHHWAHIAASFLPDSSNTLTRLAIGHQKDNWTSFLWGLGHLKSCVNSGYHLCTNSNWVHDNTFFSELHIPKCRNVQEVLPFFNFCLRFLFYLFRCYLFCYYLFWCCLFYYHKGHYLDSFFHEQANWSLACWIRSQPSWCSSWFLPTLGLTGWKKNCF